MKSYAKLNIFLKIVGTRGHYHLLSSRFVLFKSLFDTIEFVPKYDDLVLDGAFNCPLQSNTIYKALMLLNQTHPKAIEYFMQNYTIVVQKNIPQFGGLGGGSSNASTVLLMLNELLELRLKHSALLEIGLKIGADVPFFLSGYESANVFGIGEVVEHFSDEIPNIELITSDIACDTPKVYQTFREKFIDTLEPNFAQKLSKMRANEILRNYPPDRLNDLLKPARLLCPKLNDEHFLSGSGSTMFKVIDEK